MSNQTFIKQTETQPQGQAQGRKTRPKLTINTNVSPYLNSPTPYLVRRETRFEDFLKPEQLSTMEEEDAKAEEEEEEGMVLKTVKNEVQKVKKLVRRWTDVKP